LDRENEVFKKKSEQSEVNIIEKTCRELNVNKKQLAELTGFNVNTISKWSRPDSQLPKSAQKYFSLLIENHKLKTRFFSEII